jgi:hypothetical protein
MDEQALMEFTSHIDGRNAKVAIYSDRIEWGRAGYRPAGGMKAAVLTAGLSLAVPSRNRDTNMIPVRMIQGVSTHKAGLGYTTVRVATAGDATEFRVSKREAEDVKGLLLRLMNQSAPSTAAPNHGPGPSVADELRKLGELRDSGVLSEAEFAAQKSRLLGI